MVKIQHNKLFCFSCLYNKHFNNKKMKKSLKKSLKKSSKYKFKKTIKKNVKKNIKKTIKRKKIITKAQTGGTFLSAGSFGCSYLIDYLEATTGSLVGMKCETSSSSNRDFRYKIAKIMADDDAILEKAGYDEFNLQSFDPEGEMFIHSPLKCSLPNFNLADCKLPIPNGKKTGLIYDNGGIDLDRYCRRIPDSTYQRKISYGIILPKKFLDAFKNIFRAVKVLHQNGVYHLDIKMSNIVSGIPEHLIDHYKNPFYHSSSESFFQKNKIPIKKHRIHFRLIDFGMAKKDPITRDGLTNHNLARINSAIPIWSVFLFRVNLSKFLEELNTKLMDVNKKIRENRQSSDDTVKNIKLRIHLQDSIEHIISLLKKKSEIDPLSISDDEGVLADQYLRKHALDFYDEMIGSVTPFGIFYRQNYLKNITENEQNYNNEVENEQNYNNEGTYNKPIDKQTLHKQTLQEATRRETFISLFLKNKKYLKNGTEFDNILIDRIDVYSLGMILCIYSNLIYYRLSSETKPREWYLPRCDKAKFKFIADSIQKFLLDNNMLALDPMVIPSSSSINDLYLSFVEDLKSKIGAEDYSL